MILTHHMYLEPNPDCQQLLTTFHTALSPQSGSCACGKVLSNWMIFTMPSNVRCIMGFLSEGAPVVGMPTWSPRQWLVLREAS